MKVFRTIRNYYFYCGIEKDEYNAIKRDAYVSNYKVWRILHFLMAAVFGLMYLASFANQLMSVNRWFYLIAFLYSVVAVVIFVKLKWDSVIAQLLIYLSMSFLFLFATIINLDKPDYTATTFVVLLVLTPLLMIDKPYFMTIELFAASAVFLIWAYGVKSAYIWQIDMVNVVTFAIIGSFLNIIANSLRIKEFTLTRQIRVQKDTDEMTGLMNKGSLTREINQYLSDTSTNNGILFILDIDRFKSINDTYGHDVGDTVIIQLGHYLADRFTDDALTGRFGGDEFIMFIKNTDDTKTACRIADEIIAGVPQSVKLPDEREKLSISIGVALYNGAEKNYSELFKKADVALYKAKGSRTGRYCVYGA